MNLPPTADACARPSCVMLLSVWAPPAAPWHARLVGADAHVHEFDSPFQLARFVAQATSASRAACPTPAPGLR